MLALADFAGSWRVARRIDDRLAGRSGRFEGVATLTPEGPGLRYHEEGRLRMGEGPELKAHRDYLWRAGPDGIAVRFADGRPFHGFRPEGRAPGTDHPCGRDLYRVVYDLTGWPAWETVWTVAGPSKDYAMVSTYRPL